MDPKPNPSEDLDGLLSRLRDMVNEGNETEFRNTLLIYDRASNKLDFHRFVRKLYRKDAPLFGVDRHQYACAVYPAPDEQARDARVDSIFAKEAKPKNVTFMRKPQYVELLEHLAEGVAGPTPRAGKQRLVVATRRIHPAGLSGRFTL